MTRGLTKTAILAASLGLVSIVSNAAYAGSDMVIGVCLEDPETRDLRLERLHTNLGAELPAGIEPGVIGPQVGSLTGQPFKSRPSPPGRRRKASSPI